MLNSPVAELIPQPGRPKLPLRVPVEVEMGGLMLSAEVLGSTANVLLLEGEAEHAPLPPLGTLVRLRLTWDRQVLSGRLAAHGVAGRFLVSLGERAIRRTRRFPVDLPATARGAHQNDGLNVRVTDLSAGGARVENLDLPVGSEVELHFTPPGRSSPIDVLAFVVRVIDRSATPTVGVAFRLVQPSMDLLGTAASGHSVQ